MDNHHKINRLLVDLFHQIWELEENAIISGEFQDITNNDMHIIEAIGLGEGANMSCIAKKLKITVGALTTSMNALVRKQYAVRKRSEEDRRVVNIRLTEKGVRAYRQHAAFHEWMTRAVLAKLQKDEVPVLVNALEGLSNFFEKFA